MMKGLRMLSGQQASERAYMDFFHAVTESEVRKDQKMYIYLLYLVYIHVLKVVHAIKQI